MDDAYATVDAVMGAPTGATSAPVVSPVTDNPNSPAKSMKLTNSEDIYAVIDKTRKSPEKQTEAPKVCIDGKFYFFYTKIFVL